MAATDGAGVDVVIDAAGFASTWSLAIQAARPGGHIDVIGLGAVEGPVDYQVDRGEGPHARRLLRVRGTGLRAGPRPAVDAATWTWTGGS